MKKLVLVLILVLPLEIYGQNIIKVGRSLRNLKPQYIERTIHVSTSRSFQAIEIAKYQSLNKHTEWYLTNTESTVDVHIKRKLLENTLKSPNRIYGPYNYVRTFSKISKEESLTTNRHLQEWKHINQVNGYNGAHHLINKYTLKLIYEDMKKEGINVSLSDMQNNAPSIFHPLHGDPNFKDIFHNPEQQILDYNTFGMKVTIISLIMSIDNAGIIRGLPAMPREYIIGILKEAELWCKTYNLVWERNTNLNIIP
jgi:hypothetical protein